MSGFEQKKEQAEGGSGGKGTREEWRLFSKNRLTPYALPFRIHIYEQVPTV